MTENDAIISPEKRKNSSDLGAVAVMVALDNDMFFICDLLSIKRGDFNRLLMSRLYVGGDDLQKYSVIGPFIGAPYATMLLETLIAWGTNKILYFGICGAISQDVKVGDIIVPTASIIDEGTSKHYTNQQQKTNDSEVMGRNKTLARPSEYIVAKIKEALTKKELSFHEGTIWTTDAVFRETREKVADFQKMDVLAVDMEASALFTAGSFRNKEVGAILVVSDELSTFRWVKGFSENCFKKACKDVGKVISGLCNYL